MRFEIKDVRGVGKIMGAIVLLAFHTVAIGAGDSRLGEDRRALADALYSRGMFEMAQTEYAALIEAYPEISRRDVILFRMGESLRKTGNILEAEHVFHTLLREFPESDYRPQASFRRAALFLEMGHHTGALLLLDALLSENPPRQWREPALFHRAEALLALDRSAEAESAFADLVKAFPEGEYTPIAILRQAQLMGAGDHASMDRAIDLLNALSEGPFAEKYGAEALFQKALLLNTAKHHDAAAVTFLSLLNRFPESPRAREAHRSAAWACFRAERFADAQRLADQALADAALEVEARRDWLYLKANSLRRLVQPTAALDVYAELLELGAGAELTPHVRFEKAVTHFQQSEYAATLQEAEHIQDAPDAILRDLVWLQAEAASALSDPPRAAQFYRMLIERFPDSERVPDALYRLAFQLQGQGAFGEASRYYLRLGEQFPNHDLAPRALFASGICLARDGRDDEALRDWNALSERYGDHALAADAFFHAGMAHVRRDRKREALVALDVFLKRVPDSAFRPEALFWRGVLLRSFGELAEAEDSLRRALQSETLAKPLAREAAFDLALVLLERNQESDAADRFQSLLDTPALERFSSQRLRWLSEYQWHQGNFAFAADAARALRSRFSADKAAAQVGATLLGRALLSLGRHEEAAEAFSQALLLEARTAFEPEAALRLGELRLEAGNIKESIRCFHIVAAQSDQADAVGLRVAAYRGLAQAMERNGDLESALRYNLSIGLLFDDADQVPPALGDAVRLLLASQRVEDARQTVHELLERYPDAPASVVWRDRLDNLGNDVPDTTGDAP